MQEKWAGPWQRLVCEMKHSKTLIQSDSRNQSAPCQTVTSPVRGTEYFERRERFALFCPLTSCSANIYGKCRLQMSGVGASCWDSEGWHCWSKVGVSVPGAQKGWQSERARRARCTHWCNREGRGQIGQENNPCSSRLKMSPGFLLAILDLDKVWDFQRESPSDTAVSVMGKETVGCCDFPKWDELHAFLSQGT